MDQLEKIIVKLSYCVGMSNQEKWRIIQWLLEHPDTSITVTDLVNISRIKHFRSLFVQSWQNLDEEAIFREKRYITCLSSKYPKNLLELGNPPILLFYRGDLGLLQEKSISFVGARDATEEGKQVIHQLIPTLIATGFVIVSGAARGIDSFSHQEAIQAGGRTIAVIGTGFYHFYPKDQAVLQERIAQKHLLISEYPPHMGARKHHFPMRNRIIAALSLGTCVIEAKKRSGSLITAQQALDLGREVFSVPGSITNNRSEGCHQLIQDGAKLTSSAADILNEFSWRRF
ncbi:MAG: DNA-processing protein DprA [Enterococcus sp.]